MRGESTTVSLEFEKKIGNFNSEPLYTSKDFRLGGSSQLSPLYEMTNSHLLNLADLLRKRTETQTPY